MSFEQWKQEKLPFIDTSQISTPNVAPIDNSQIDLDVSKTPGNTDQVTTDETVPPAPTEITSCQKCEGGFPVNVAPVDGQCPEGSEPEDLDSNPCDKQQDISTEEPEDKKADGENDCPPTYEWDEESKTCKPGRNFMRPFAKVPKIAAKIKRNLDDKKNELKRQSITTKSDVVFADTIGEDYQGDTDVNTGKKVGRNVYSRQGAYGTEIDKFTFSKGGQATIDMETYKKLIKAGAKLDIID